MHCGYSYKNTNQNLRLVEKQIYPPDLRKRKLILKVLNVQFEKQKYIVFSF